MNGPSAVEGSFEFPINKRAPMKRPWVIAASISGLLAVALGAFGAHGLEGTLEAATDGVKRLEWWQTAAHYHLVHSVALLGVAWLADARGGRAPQLAGWAFVIGIVLFSGSLYAMTLTNVRALGMITPLGGTAMLVGWGALAFAGTKK